MSKTFAVEGMSCGGCAQSVTNAIQQVVPAVTVTVDLDRKTVTVDGSAEESVIAAAVDGAGYQFVGPVG